MKVLLEALASEEVDWPHVADYAKLVAEEVEFMQPQEAGRVRAVCAVHAPDGPMCTRAHPLNH